MANCVRCGRELPSLTFGELSDLCRQCRAGDAAPPADRAAAVPPARITFTNAVIAINVLVLAAMAIVAGRNAGTTLASPGNAELLRWGADFGPLTFGTQWWRAFTSMWVHAGVVHLFLNMWCLRDYGRIAEGFYGRKAYAFLYICAGLCGSIASLAWHPLVVSIGASAAVFGVVGSLIPPYRRGLLGSDPEALKRARKSLFSFVGYNLIIGFAVPAIDNAAHIGGLLGGLALGFLLIGQGAQPRQKLALKFVTIATAVIVGLFLSTWLIRRWDILPYQAGVALDAGKINQAISKAKAAVEHSQNDPFAYTMLGAAYLNNAQYLKAATAFERAIQLRPDSEYALARLGTAYVQLDRWEQARQVLERAVALDKDKQDAEARLDLGIALEGLEREEEALNSVQAALRIDPKLSHAHYTLGLILEGRKDRDKAIASYEEAFRLEPDNVEYGKHLAAAYDAKGLHDEAERVRRAVSR